VYAYDRNQAKDAHVGTVKSYTAPTTPQAPSLPSDLASELSKFDSLEPALASSTPATKDVSAEAGEEGAAGANEYLAFLEKDLPKADAAHH
jgi:F-type H+-transporting ATPase subunit h